MKAGLFAGLFSSWLVLVVAGQALAGSVNLLLALSRLMVLGPVMQGRHPFES